MMDRERAAKAIEEFLRALGQPSEGELVGTGRRVADAFCDEFLQSGPDASALIVEGRIATSEQLGPVILRDLSVATMCPHHLLPAHGFATVGYFPGAFIAGLGVVAQAVDALCRRLVLQETLGADIARTLNTGLQSRAAFCRLSLTHTCFTARGERQSNARVETFSVSSGCSEAERELAERIAFSEPSASRTESRA